MSNRRDNFSEATKRILAIRVGYRCSNPNCNALTVGPASQPRKIINVGEAAHITAASPGGPRYDPRINSQERIDIANGIWLCRKCAKMVDDDPNTYSAIILRGWKRLTEQTTLIECQKGHPSVSSYHIAFYPITGALTTNFEDNLKSAAIDDLNKFRHYLKVPDSAVKLRLVSNVDKNHFEITNFIDTIQNVRRLGIISPPGTGKTTTLIQLAEAIHEAKHEVAVFVPLGSWLDESCTLLESISRRTAFKNFKQHELLQLADQDKLTLFLDGWNELNQTARQRAITELENLSREYPLLKLVISSRQQAMELPLEVYQLQVEPLSYEQQVTISRSIFGDGGERLLDTALRTQGINELVSIPFYLTALISTPGNDTLPTTKEEVLRHFVNNHEKRSLNAEALDKVVLGKHKEILTELGSEATRTANSSITETRARTVVYEAEKHLHEEGQLSNLPEPKDILEILVKHHVVVCSGEKLISFQHQQFQEWYASFKVESMILALSYGDADALKRLKTEILNVPTWEEPVLFACERLSGGSDDQKRTLTDVIRITLYDIDPMFAAEMIYRCTDDIWEFISGEVCRFVERWHTPGKVDRAARFMIRTGRSDFSEKIWELILDINQQQNFSIFRGAYQFRPRILGTDSKTRFLALPVYEREIIIPELMLNSGIEGMELGAEWAKADKSGIIKINAITSLYFRRGERLIREILKDVPREFWLLMALEFDPTDFIDPEISARIEREQAQMIHIETDRFRTLIAQINHNGKVSKALSKEMEDIIANADFPIEDTYVIQSLSEVRTYCLETLQRSYLRRLESGLELPSRCDDIFLNAPIVDDGTITELAFNQNEFNERTKYAAAIVGPKTIARVLNAYLKIGSSLKPGANLSKAQMDKYHSLRSWLLHTRDSQFIKVWLRRGKQKRPKLIAELAQLLSHHGSQYNSRERLHLSDGQSSRAATILNFWADLLINDSRASRGNLADIASAIGRLGRGELLGTLNRLFEEDRRRQIIQRADFIKSKYQNTSSTDVHVSYKFYYRNAFVGLGGQETCAILESYLTDPEFGIDAAIGLKEIYEQMNGLKENKTWLPFAIDYSKVAIRREENLRGVKYHDCEQASAIFRAVESLLSGNSYTEEEIIHAKELARVASKLPHTPRPELTRKLLGFSIPWEAKRNYLSELIQTGEVVHADMVLAGLKELLDDSGNNVWHLNQNNVWKPGLWLQLLPFSDRPYSLLEALEMIGHNYVQPWQLRDTLRALGHAPDNVAEDILFELAERMPELCEEQYWSIAVFNRKTSSACLKFCEIAAANPNIVSELGSHFCETKLVDFIKEEPEFRSKLLRFYNDDKYNLNVSFIDQTLAKVADVKTILTMINRYEIQRRSFDSNLDTAIESIVLEKRPSTDWEGAYETHSVEASDIRSTLFNITHSDEPAAHLAAVCLNRIDELRDEHGCLDMEPRHPNIEAGLPWVFIPT